MTGRWISMHDFLRALEGEAADYFAADGREKELDSLSQVSNHATERARSHDDTPTTQGRSEGDAP